MSMLYLHGTSAAAVWEQPRILERCDAADPLWDVPLPVLVGEGPARFAREAIPAAYVPDIAARDLAVLELQLGLSDPVSITVGEANCRRRSKHMHAFTMPKGIDPEQFVQVDGQAYVACPELTLLQLASALSTVELAAMCSRYMAFYEKCPHSETGIVLRQPLTSPDRLTAFIAQGTRVKHMGKLAAAAELAISRTASPMEIFIGMLFALDQSRGGYGLGSPLANHPIDTSAFYQEGERHMRYCDLYYPRLQLDIEYDGRSAHERRAGMGSDALRHNELAALGITDFIVTKEQAFSTTVLDSIANCIIESYGLKPVSYTSRFREAQDTLTKALLCTL